MIEGGPRQSVVIDGATPSWPAYFKELYRYRAVAKVLIRRDLIIRFRQTFFGVAWLLFKPLMMMLVISVAFGLVGRFENSTAAPYPLVVLCGVIPWYFVTNAVSDGIHSILGHLHIIQKTYFPRIILPLVSIAINVIELCVAWVLFAAVCVWYGFLPTAKLLALPFFLLLTIAAATGVSLWLSLLHARFRDVGNLVPFLLSITFFVTPIGYTLQAIPEHWRAVYALNPLVGIIEGIRWCLLADAFNLPVAALQSSVLWSVGLFLSGLWYFRKHENAIVDFA